MAALRVAIFATTDYYAGVYDAGPHNRKPRYFRGWEVVAGCFVMAMVSWGLGFYGTGLYLAYLVGERGMPIAQSPAASPRISG